MFERFTTEARLAVIEAQEQARARADDRIRTEHLLLALIARPDGVAVAVLRALGADPAAVRQAIDRRRPNGPGFDAEALAILGIDLDEVRRQAEDAFGPGALDRTRAGRGLGRPPAHIPFERAAKKGLELALREALRLEHRSIGAEHILLGVLHAEGVAHDVLTDLGLRLDAARAVVAALARRAG